MAVSLGMIVPDPQDLIRHGVRRETPATSECIHHDTIAALAQGTLDDATRAAALSHLAECRHCRAAVASVARAMRDPSVATEIARVSDGRRRFLPLAVPIAAAAAVVLMVVIPRGNDGVEPTHRAPTITAGAAPVLQSPVGIVAAAETLRWGSVSGADRYRTTLFDDDGAVVYETQTADTLAALPDSVQLIPSRSYLWKVEARTGFGRWSGSDLIEFSVR